MGNCPGNVHIQFQLVKERRGQIHTSPRHRQVENNHLNAPGSFQEIKPHPLSKRLSRHPWLSPHSAFLFLTGNHPQSPWGEGSDFGVRPGDGSVAKLMDSDLLKVTLVRMRITSGGPTFVMRCLVTQGPKWMCLFERQKTLQGADLPPLIPPPSGTSVTRPPPNPPPPEATNFCAQGRG